jgi:ATP-dependent Clp protease ATP-binding subunit ClpA
MSAEYAPETANVMAVEHQRIEPVARHVRKKLASYALEDFLILDSVESPYEAMRKELEAMIVEQPAAIDAIIDAVDRHEVRLPGDNRPIANLAFLGPTGVGKSETAKVLSQVMEGGYGNLIKLDCSNFSHGHEVASLTGSPPGYIGREQNPFFSKQIIEQPGTVVLFDEVEKGSPQLYNLMLQIMGDGELRLNNGNLVSFRDAIIVLTSNLGAKEMSAQLTGTPLGFNTDKKATDKDSLETVAKKNFEEFFTPEFVNRLNKLVVFHPLSEEGLGKVLDTKLEQINVQYEQQYGARVSLSETTRTHLVEIAAKEPHLGARPLVRALEDNIQSTFGRYVGTGQVGEGTHIRVFHQSELPQNMRRASDGTLIFATRPDPTIRKAPLALLQRREIEVEQEEYDEDPEPNGTEPQ